MIVQCERCETKFRLDDERVSEKGVKARCSQCQNIFVVRKPPMPAVEPPEGFEVEGESLRAPVSYSEDSSVRPRKLFLRALVLLLILALVGGGVFLFRDRLVSINWEALSLSSLRKYVGSGVSTGESIVFPESQIRGYYIDNTKVSRIFVIEGRALNISSEVKSHIKVRGALLDSMGNKVMEKEVYCGNILSEDELVKLDAREIDSRLNDPAGDSSINLNVPPQQSIPFMVVFFHLPDDVKEFGVESAGTQKAVR
ncbi:MAG: DUF3426 domain-containing protein [Pseudomonadota bacterium]